jgi:hypothetical protein
VPRDPVDFLVDWDDRDAEDFDRDAEDPDRDFEDPEFRREVELLLES